MKKLIEILKISRENDTDLDDEVIVKSRMIIQIVCDEFAIEFKDWCDKEGRFTIGVNTTKELLHIYKKEKGYEE